MLVLTRKKGQSLMIGHDVEIAIIDIQGDQVRVGISAPKSVSVHRKEVFEEIRQENVQANQHASIADAEVEDLLKSISRKTVDK